MLLDKCVILKIVKVKRLLILLLRNSEQDLLHIFDEDFQNLELVCEVAVKHARHTASTLLKDLLVLQENVQAATLRHALKLVGLVQLLSELKHLHNCLILPDFKVFCWDEILSRAEVCLRRETKFLTDLVQ